jgi:hypothetical protein
MYTAISPTLPAGLVPICRCLLVVVQLLTPLNTLPPGKPPLHNGVGADGAVGLIRTLVLPNEAQWVR